VNEAALRAGSVEILAALAIFAVVAARPRAHRPGDTGPSLPVRIALEVAHAGAMQRYEGVCPMVVGRSSSANVMVLDPEVSRLHARFEAQHGTVYVSDAGSSNGTFFNGRRLDGAIEVRPNDTIDVGTTRISYVGKLP
jgi:hypothetical protein